MIVTQYGYYKPQTDDTGNVFFPDMAANIARLDQHSHAGVDSAILQVFTQTISSGSWSAVSGQPGTYSQVVTLPTVNGVQLLYDQVSIEFRLSTGEKVYPSVVRSSSSTMTVYFNDNSKSLTAVYAT